MYMFSPFLRKRSYLMYVCNICIKCMFMYVLFMVIIFIVIVHNPIANNFIVVAILGSLFPMEIYTCSTLIDYFNSYSTIKN